VGCPWAVWVAVRGLSGSLSVGSGSLSVGLSGLFRFPPFGRPQACFWGALGHVRGLPRGCPWAPSGLSVGCPWAPSGLADWLTGWLAGWLDGWMAG
jgi:hypothetical protein